MTDVRREGQLSPDPRGALGRVGGAEQGAWGTPWGAVLLPPCWASKTEVQLRAPPRVLPQPRPCPLLSLTACVLATPPWGTLHQPPRRPSSVPVAMGDPGSWEELAGAPGTGRDGPGGGPAPGSPAAAGGLGAPGSALPGHSVPTPRPPSRSGTHGRFRVVRTERQCAEPPPTGPLGARAVSSSVSGPPAPAPGRCPWPYAPAAESGTGWCSLRTGPARAVPGSLTPSCYTDT